MYEVPEGRDHHRGPLSPGWPGRAARPLSRPPARSGPGLMHSNSRAYWRGLRSHSCSRVKPLPIRRRSLPLTLTRSRSGLAALPVFWNHRLRPNGAPRQIRRPRLTADIGNATVKTWSSGTMAASSTMRNRGPEKPRTTAGWPHGMTLERERAVLRRSRRGRRRQRTPSEPVTRARLGPVSDCCRLVGYGLGQAITVLPFGTRVTVRA